MLQVTETRQCTFIPKKQVMQTSLEMSIECNELTTGTR